MFHYDFVANLSDRNVYLLYCNTCTNNKIVSFFHTLHICVSFIIRIKSEYIPEYQQTVLEIDGLCLLQCCAMIQGDSLARGPKLFSMKNYVIEIRT